MCCWCQLGSRALEAASWPGPGITSRLPLQDRHLNGWAGNKVLKSVTPGLAGLCNLTAKPVLRGPGLKNHTTNFCPFLLKYKGLLPGPCSRQAISTLKSCWMLNFSKIHTLICHIIQVGSHLFCVGMESDHNPSLHSWDWVSKPWARARHYVYNDPW